MYIYESVTLSHFSQSLVPLKLIKFVVFYWSRIKRNACMLGVRFQSRDHNSPVMALVPVYAAIQVFELLLLLLLLLL